NVTLFQVDLFADCIFVWEIRTGEPLIHDDNSGSVEGVLVGEEAAGVQRSANNCEIRGRNDAIVGGGSAPSGVETASRNGEIAKCTIALHRTVGRCGHVNHSWQVAHSFEQFAKK